MAEISGGRQYDRGVVDRRADIGEYGRTTAANQRDHSEQRS
jgi:hypothetical protein